MKSPKYIGKAEYCYSNSTAMLLSSIGEDTSPSKIEVLSGVGLGAFWEPKSHSLFFSNLCAEPDEGISRALTILGFEFEEKNSEEPGNPPFEDLRRVLSNGPAILGPLELGLLSYNPHMHGPIGADHFVLAYAMDDERVYLNDPFGFPQVSLTFEQLERAWRAETIVYKRGYYRYWFNPIKSKTLTEKEIYNEALTSFVKIYQASREKATKNNILIGSEAILYEANRIVEEQAAPDEIGFLTHFMLPMSSSRAMDYANFFRPYNANLANIKDQQAVLFGQAQVFAVEKNWNKLKAIMTELANLEDSFSHSLIGIPWKI